MCALAAMARSAACPTTDNKRASGIGDWDASEWHKERGRVARPAMVEGQGVASRRACCGGRGRKARVATVLRDRADKHISEWRFVFIPKRDGTAPVEPCPDGSHGRASVLDHYRLHICDNDG
jgi:hypothetical protein